MKQRFAHAFSAVDLLWLLHFAPLRTHPVFFFSFLMKSTCDICVIFLYNAFYMTSFSNFMPLRMKQAVAVTVWPIYVNDPCSDWPPCTAAHFESKPSYNTPCSFFCRLKRWIYGNASFSHPSMNTWWAVFCILDFIHGLECEWYILRCCFYTIPRICVH